MFLQEINVDVRWSNLGFSKGAEYGKIKVSEIEIIVTGKKEKPYFEIKYREVGKRHYNIGFSSYNLDYVFDWKEKCFEVIKPKRNIFRKILGI